MKKIILLLLLIAIVFVAYNRQRLYLRDPLGSVLRDGVKEDGAQVFINFSNDVLLENDHSPSYVFVVQHDNHIGTPQRLACLHFVICLADADPVPLLAPDSAAVVDSMTGKAVQYHEGHRNTTINLR